MKSEETTFVIVIIKIFGGCGRMILTFTRRKHYNKPCPIIMITFERVWTIPTNDGGYNLDNRTNHEQLLSDQAFGHRS